MTQVIINLINILLLFGFIACNNTSNINDNENPNLVANAGEDQTTLTGSYGIFDPTKSTGNYNWEEWQQDSSNPEKVQLFSQDKQSKTEWDIKKIVFVKEGIYKFTLTVKSNHSNDGVSSEPDTLVIRVIPNPFKKFEDPNLEAIVRAKLNKQTEELDDNKLLELDSLSSAEVIPVQRILSLKGLEKCKNLVFLGLSSQDISDISPLSALQKLRFLLLDQNYKINDLIPLKDLTELEELNLDSNLLTDISPLIKLIKLRYLHLQYNSISSIYSVKNMTLLEQLWMSHAIISDLKPLENLTNLELLWLNNCGIKDISVLEYLKNVKILKLAWNNIEDITPLKYLEKLQWLAFEKNNISDISSLKDLKNLGYVRLWDNKIVDIKSLVDNSFISKDDIVGLDGNPLGEKSINEYIPLLQARGVLVTW